jgi:hypothetical protein
MRGPPVTVLLEAFVLVVLAGSFLEISILNQMGLDTQYRIGIGITIVGLAWVASHAAFKGQRSASSQPEPSKIEQRAARPKTSQPTAESGVTRAEESTTAHGKATSQESTHRQSTALGSMSDGQRVVLMHKLEAYRGSVVRIVHVGSDPFTFVTFERLKDVFRESGWSIQAAQIGLVGIVGENYPSGPYLTANDISLPKVTAVYSIFSELGIDLPLVPNAFMGSGKPCDVVIVIH